MPDDLTPEEQQELENIRRRKRELQEDIEVRRVLRGRTGHALRFFFFIFTVLQMMILVKNLNVAAVLFCIVIQCHTTARYFNNLGILFALIDFLGR